MKKKIKYIITYIYCNYILKLAKVNNNKVVFIITNQCYDNCLAMVFYLSNNLRDIDIKILVDESEFNKYEKLLYNQRNVSVISAGHNFWKSNYELITAKYVFFMHRRPFEHINRRAGQYVINLWHGSGYKDVASTEGTWHEGKDFDYVLVPGDVFVKPKAKFFSCSEERVLAWGYPRYDFFKTKSKNAIEFRNEIIGKDNKFIIWLPTFRKKKDAKEDSAEASIKYDFDIPLLRSNEEMELLNMVCKEYKIKILVKRHPFQKQYACENNVYSNIIFMSNVELDKNKVTLYELLTVTDGMISDYSSVAIDYMLLDKPMAFCLDDFEQYKETRGFVFDDPLQYMPGEYLYTVNDLISYLRDVANENDIYREKRKSIMSLVHNRSTNYCETIWNGIVDITK